MGRRPPRQARRDLAGPEPEKADSQAHQRGLQRARPAGTRRHPRRGLPGQHRGLQEPAEDHHRLARRQARTLPLRARQGRRRRRAGRRVPQAGHRI